MAAVTLYTFTDSAGNFITVFRDSDRLSLVDFFSTHTGGAETPQPPFGEVINYACQAGTFDRYDYSSEAMAPYASFIIEHNSEFCGYVRPACDIYIKSFTKTDESTADNNNGTGNLFAVSSFGLITYTIFAVVGPFTETNTTGLFTALVPGDYYIIAVDSNECFVTQDFTIVEFDTSQTNWKWTLGFVAVDKFTNWQLRFYDLRNLYPTPEYPKPIQGTEQPVVIKTDDPNEDKTTAICSKQLTINLWYNGQNFVPDEFYKVPEQSWRLELYKNGSLEFIGYLLPDEAKDFYMDAPYAIQLIATDGLPSLKGNTFGNGSGGQGYSTFQIQQYGLAAWSSLVKQCLDQLRYNYGNTVLISSLQYNNTYNYSQWLQISTWSDFLYDSSGVAVDTYTALTNLLQAFKLTIFQHAGRFYMVNWNDLSYINSPLVVEKFYQSFYEFSADMSEIIYVGINVARPLFQTIGFNQIYNPINPPQNKNLDKAYNLEADINFNTLALLYANPSFEIGAVQGELPPGFDSPHGGMNAYLNYDPVVDGVAGSGAYDGNWEFKVQTSGDFASDKFTENGPTHFIIDQYGKLLNVSFVWKVPFCSESLSGFPLGYVYSFTCCFIDSSDDLGYFLSDGDNHKTISYQDFLINGHNPAAITAGLTWLPLAGSGSPYFTEGDAYSIKGDPTTDNIGWQSFNITAPPFPGSQIGTVSIRFYGCKLQLFDYSKYVTGNPAYNSYLFFDGPISDPGYYLIDMMQITLSDGAPNSTLQTGETHTCTAVTGIPQADLKTIPLSLFTYPNNKRVSGNVFTIDDYTTGLVSNLWSFALNAYNKLDRLPATIIKAIARNYSRPMYIWEGDISANYMAFYGVFAVDGIPGKLFMPFSVEIDCRQCICHVIIVEMDDSPEQFIYSYTAIYQNNAKQISQSIN